MRCTPLVTLSMLVFVVSSVAVVGRVHAAETKPACQKADEGFVDLFDGQTLKGWHGDTENYTFRGKILDCDKKGGRLESDKKYGNFVLRFEYKLEPGGNNGIDVRGMEIQILDDTAPKHAHLKACQYNGSVYCHVPAERGHDKPLGEWNDEEIRVEGKHVKVTLNGAVIVDADTDLEALEKPKGPIAFKGHHEHVEFRNLRIKELP